MKTVLIKVKHENAEFFVNNIEGSLSQSISDFVNETIDTLRNNGSLGNVVLNDDRIDEDLLKSLPYHELQHIAKDLDLKYVAVSRENLINSIIKKKED